jgi:hypothetical protein
MNSKIHVMLKLIKELGVQVSAGPQIDITPTIKELCLKYPNEMQAIVDHLNKKNPDKVRAKPLV